MHIVVNINDHQISFIIVFNNDFLISEKLKKMCKTCWLLHNSHTHDTQVMKKNIDVVVQLIHI